MLISVSFKNRLSFWKKLIFFDFRIWALLSCYAACYCVTCRVHHAWHAWHVDGRPCVLVCWTAGLCNLCSYQYSWTSVPATDRCGELPALRVEPPSPLRRTVADSVVRRHVFYPQVAGVSAQRFLMQLNWPPTSRDWLGRLFNVCCAEVVSCTLNAHVSDAQSVLIETKVHRSTDWLPSLPLTHADLPHCVCLMQHPAWQPLSHSHYTSHATVKSSASAPVCWPRWTGGEGGEADVRGVDDRPWQWTNSWLLAWTDPALSLIHIWRCRRRG